MNTDKMIHVPHSVDTPSEIDYSTQPENDFDALSRDRTIVRSLSPEDLADVARIDAKITGRDRTDYISEKIEEALVESGIRVSLVATVDKVVSGYLMARVDYGDFGHTDSIAVIDTVGVNPGLTDRGVGKALLSQLLINLAALGVERVETTVPSRNTALLGFLQHCGFIPAERIAFTKSIE